MQQQHSAILEENHYYAYGLRVAGISSKRLSDAHSGLPSNNYLYQGDYSEFDEEIGWNDFALRSYDPQVGRFVNVDPYDQFASPYLGMGCDPVNGVDPSGGFVYNPEMLKAAVGIAKSGSSALSTTLGIASFAIKSANLVLSDKNAETNREISSNNLQERDLKSNNNDDCPTCPYEDKFDRHSRYIMSLDTDQRKDIAELYSSALPIGELIGWVGKGLYRGVKAIRLLKIVPAAKYSKVLLWGKNATGHLIKHADVLGFPNYTPQQLQKMIPELKAAAELLYKEINPSLTRIGRWGGQSEDVLMHITKNGKMIVTKLNGEFITAINKTSNNWYQLARPF